MPETTIKFTTDASGAIKGIEQVGGALTKLDTATKQSKSGIAEFAGGLNNLKAGFDMVSGALGGVINTTAELVNLGTAARQTREGFDILSGGHTADYLELMRASTRGLATDTDLLKSGMKALTVGVATTGQQLADLSKAGTVMGRVMGISAAEGIETLTQAMIRVGQTRLLDNIGLSALHVEARFKELKRTMTEDKAWATAVLEEAATKAQKLEGTLDGAGAGVKRLENAFTSLKTSAGENLSYLLDQTLNLIGALDEYYARQGKGTTSPKGTVPGLTDGKMPDLAYMTAIAQSIADLQKKQEDALKYKFLYFDGASKVDALLRGAFGQGSLFRSDTWTGAAAGVDYDKQYRDAILAQQTAREMAKRAANKSYQPFTQMGGQLGDIGGDFFGASFTAAGNAFKRQSQAPEALALFNKVLAGGQALLDPYAKGINKIADAWNNMNEAAKRGQSLSAAFGTTGGGLFGEIGGNMEDLFGKARETHLKELEKQYGANTKKINEGIAALNKKYGGNTKDAGYQKELRNLYGQYGTNTTAINKGMATFDKGEKEAIDAYKIATGQATKASLEFDKQLENLGKRLTDGKITPQQYAKELRDLGLAAQNSGGDLDKLWVAMGRSADAGSTKVDPAKNKGVKKWGIDPKKNAYTGPQTIDTDHTTFNKTDDTDPFASMNTSLDGVDTKIKNITESTRGIPSVMQTQFQDAAEKVKPLKTELDKVEAVINRTLASNSRVKITYEVTGTGGAVPGGGSGGRKI